jgi:hypothetical protein
LLTIGAINDKVAFHVRIKISMSGVVSM